MNAFSNAERAATLAHYTREATIARAPKYKRTAVVSIAGKFEADAAYSLQCGAVFLDAIKFDGVNWCDPAEFLLPSAIALIERDIQETIAEAGQ